jgi:hypothetical protein
LTSVIIRVYVIDMLSLFRQLAKYGAVFIEAQDKRWYVACEVKLNPGSNKKFVKLNGEKLYWALSDLIPLAKSEYQELLKEARTPKQQRFEYGSTTDYTDIV